MSNYSFDQYTAVRLLSRPRFAPDGNGFAYLANTTGIPNLWWQPSGGGFPRQLTAFTTQRVTAFEYSPDGRRIALLADRDGDEMHQVYVMDAAGGWPRQLTDAPEVQFSLAGWTPDSRRIVATGNDREPTEMDPLLIDPDTGEVDRLMTGGQFYAAGASPDGRWLSVIEYISNTSQRIVLLDLATRETRTLLAGTGSARAADEGIRAWPVAWRADSSGLFAVTDSGQEFTGLAFVPVDGGAWRYLLSGGEVESDVEDAVTSRDGTVLAAALNVGGATQLRLWRVEGGGEVPMPAPELPLGVVGSAHLAPDGGQMLLGLTTPRSITNLWLLDLATGERRTVEQGMLGGVPEDDMIEPALIGYPSFDRDIPAWLYRPRGAGPFPVVLSIHGGPEGQEQPDYAYAGLYQYLLSRGIGVLAPNIRGSSGYGKAYQKLIYRDWGGDELKDIEAAARYLRRLDWVDADRIGVFGGSFGGFATLSALTRLSEYWAVGVDWVGPANLVTFVASVPPHWREMMAAWVGDPERDEEMLVARSPITHADQLRAPLLVVQGANDPRVVKAESDQFVEKLRARGVEVEYVVDDKAGHGPPDRDGLTRWLRITVDFLEQYLVT